MPARARGRNQERKTDRTYAGIPAEMQAGSKDDGRDYRQAALRAREHGGELPPGCAGRSADMLARPQACVQLCPGAGTRARPRARTRDCNRAGPPADTRAGMREATLTSAPG